MADIERGVRGCNPYPLIWNFNTKRSISTICSYAETPPPPQSPCRIEWWKKLLMRSCNPIFKKKKKTWSAYAMDLFQTFSYPPCRRSLGIFYVYCEDNDITDIWCLYNCNWTITAIVFPTHFPWYSNSLVTFSIEQLSDKSSKDVTENEIPFALCHLYSAFLWTNGHKIFISVVICVMPSAVPYPAMGVLINT